jgi:hypothetical protein
VSNISVRQSPDGTWSVVRDDEVIVAGLSNLEAWSEATPRPLFI